MAFSFPFCGRAAQFTQTVHSQLQKQELTAAPALTGYGKPPWIFKGRAIYQLHLVKTEIARAIVPKEFKLLEAFGYTLGGFFLASYEDSPPGIFDELVVIAGTGNVWNNPTSCAWAASVFVNSEDACVHGRQEFGLPSQVATFTKSIKGTKKSKMKGVLSIGYGPKNGMIIQIDTPAIALTSNKWMGPLINMSLPSFSGRTEYNPHLLNYSCQIQSRVRPVSPAKVIHIMNGSGTYTRDISMDIMLSKPILAFQFNSLKMVVDPPVIV